MCSAFVLTAFGDMVMKEYMDFTIALMMGEDRDKLVICIIFIISLITDVEIKIFLYFYCSYFCQADVMIEMHALLSSAKPLCSWHAQHGIQECREACGGHGYLQGNF